MEPKSVHVPSPMTLGALPTHHGDETGTCHSLSLMKEGGHHCIGLCMLTQRSSEKNVGPLMVDLDDSHSLADLVQDVFNAVVQEGDLHLSSNMATYSSISWYVELDSQVDVLPEASHVREGYSLPAHCWGNSATVANLLMEAANVMTEELDKVATPVTGGGLVEGGVTWSELQLPSAPKQCGMKWEMSDPLQS